MADPYKVGIDITTTADVAAANLVSDAMTRVGQRAADAAKRAEDEFDGLFEHLKEGVAEALDAGGARPEFVAHVTQEYDKLKATLKATGADAALAQQKIAALAQELVKAAQAERQFVEEAKIYNEVMAKGAWSPAEDNARWAGKTANINKTTAAMRGLKGGVGQAALTMQAFVDDAQYGLRGVMNNIPGLVAAFGGGAGLAGVVGIAAIALAGLWEHFSGAKEAAEKVEEAKVKFAELTSVLEEVREASKKTFQDALEKYIADIDKATESWGRQKAAIGEALTAANELAKAQAEHAKAKMEFEKQQKLAAATSQAERDGINAAYAKDSSTASRKLQEDELKRAHDAQLTQVNVARSNTKAQEDAKAGLVAKSEEYQQSTDAITKGGMAGRSDQERRLGQGMMANAGITLNEEKLRQNNREAANLPGKQSDEPGDYSLGSSRDRFAEIQAENESLEKQLKSFYAQRDAANLTRASDEAKVKDGKLTYGGLKKEMETASDPAFANAAAAAETDLATLAEARANIAKEIKKADENILAAKLAEQDQLKAMAKLKLEQDTVKLQNQTADFVKQQQAAKAGPTHDPIGQIIPAPLPSAGAFPAGPGQPVPPVLPPPSNGFIIPPLPGPGTSSVPTGARALPPAAGMTRDPIGQVVPGALPDVEGAAKDATASNEQVNAKVMGALEKMVSSFVAMAGSNKAMESRLATMESQIRNAAARTA